MFVTGILFTSCSKVPQAEIDSANASIQMAKDAEAEIFVNDQFLALQDSMNNILVLIEAQKSKTFANYSEVKKKLTEVDTLAAQVKANSQLRKEEMRKEIETSISELKNLIETNKNLILEAPRGKEGTTALMAIKSELTTIESNMNEAISMFEQGQYPSTQEMVNAAREKASSINAELSTVIAKYKANVRSR